MTVSKRNEYEGVIVLGPPRSGTTLLRRLLDGHPMIACPPETNVFAGMGRFMREDRFVDGATLGAVSGLAYAGLPPEETLDALRELAFGLHRMVAKRQGKPIWASKTAADAFYVDAIEALCGTRSRFVCIMRHGLDVACSVQELCVKQETYLPEFFEYVRKWPFPLEAFATMWRDLTTRIADFVREHPHNAISVRYEDLAADPHSTMERLFSFIGVSYERSLVDEALQRRENIGPGDYKAYRKDTIDTSSVGRWKALPQDTKSRLGAIVNPTLEACGYERVPVSPEASTEEARRRYQMGLALQSMRRPPE